MAGQNRVWLDRRITPHLSISPRGLVWLSVAIMVPALAFGIAMLVLKAWPVTCFLGAESLLAIAALHWCARRLSEVGERVLLTDDMLLVEAWDRNGTVTRARLEPAWVRLERQVHDFFGCEAVFLCIYGRRIRIAQALDPSAREQLADSIEKALHERKRGFIQGGW